MSIISRRRPIKKEKKLHGKIRCQQQQCLYITNQNLIIATYLWLIHLIKLRTCIYKERTESTPSAPNAFCIFWWLLRADPRSFLGRVIGGHFYQEYKTFLGGVSKCHYTWRGVWSPEVDVGSGTNLCQLKSRRTEEKKIKSICRLGWWAEQSDKKAEIKK